MKRFIQQLMLIEPLDEYMEAAKDLLLDAARNNDCEQLEEVLMAATANGSHRHWLPFTELWEHYPKLCK